MKKLGNYYGATLLEEIDSNNENKIMLEYYEIKKHSIEKTKLKTFYGITIVKKEYGKDKIKLEKNSINKISTNESKTIGIIEMLKKYKVTPVGLNDVIADLLKQPQFQGE